MRVTAQSVSFVPELEEARKRHIVSEALQQVARRVGAVQSDLADLRLDDLQLEMPIAAEQVQSGQYTAGEAADFLANRIFKALLPRLGPNARLEDVLQRARAYGSAAGFQGGPAITPQHLRERGLVPKWSFELRGVRYHFTDPFLLGGRGRRVCFVCYVEQGGAVHVRVIYTSQSQGVWRAASHRVTGAGHLGIGAHWIGKGNPHEESTDVPWELYGELDRRSAGLADMGATGGEQVFYGLLEEKTLEDVLRGTDKPTEGFYPQESRQLGRFGAQTGEYGRPETFSFTRHDDAPDFSRRLGQFQVQSRMHGGSLEAHAFASRDGRLAYLFYRDAQGRAWLATVQDLESAITSRGARRRVIDAGNLSMPLFEYRDQIPAEYRGQPLPENPSYYDAWEYVKRLPIVVELYQAMGWSMPGGAPAATTTETPTLVGRRSRTPAIGQRVRVRRSDGSITPGTVVAIAGDTVTVEVMVGNQVGTKPVPSGQLLPGYQAGERVNVPRSDGSVTPGQVLQLQPADAFVCGFMTPQGQATKPVPGVELDEVN